MTAPLSDSKGAAIKDKINDILEEYRKTCWLVKDNLDNDEAVSLQALANINTRDAILAILAQEVIEELKRVAAHNNSEYTSDYLEDRIKDLERLG